MSEQTLNDFFDTLIEVLIDELVFYIPAEVVPKNIVEKVNKMNKNSLFNELHVIAFGQGWLGYEQEEFRPLLLKKHESLEKNLFKLLQKKGETEPFKFTYILDKYVEQVEFYQFITALLKNYLPIYIKNGNDPDLQGDFQFQANYYKKHLGDLMKHFYPSREYIFKQEFDILELLENYVPDFVARCGIENKDEVYIPKVVINQQEDVNEMAETSTKNVNEKTKKIKKELLITEKIADDFILSSVFNIQQK